ncbi:hypothetical protein KSP40_PGU000943 [Platanthera guangdongensis]|uniref:Uncharacterized protein n=1 Tax=Platanthera guangdongensis TaxID=2320717 RepID=A0ABR2M1N0_9ASPA
MAMTSAPGKLTCPQFSGLRRTCPSASTARPFLLRRAGGYSAGRSSRTVVAMAGSGKRKPIERNTEKTQASLQVDAEERTCSDTMSREKQTIRTQGSPDSENGTKDSISKLVADLNSAALENDVGKNV